MFGSLEAPLPQINLIGKQKIEKLHKWIKSSGIHDFFLDTFFYTRRIIKKKKKKIPFSISFAWTLFSGNHQTYKVNLQSEKNR